MTDTAVPEEEQPNSPDDKKAEESKKDSAQNKSEQKVEQNTDISLGKNIRILSDKPIAYLDKGKIKAYRAVASNKGVSDLVALICHKSLTSRRMASIKYAKVVNPNLVKLVDTDKVFWPNTSQENFCFVYENTLGHPIWTDRHKNPTMGWKPEVVLESIAHPIINILIDLRNKDLVHGEIWPGNMFFNGADAKKFQKGEKIKLGECLAAPASSLLPALYEPIERALADPIAKGIGTFSDDLYAFGVSLAMILRSTDGLKGLSDAQIIEQKIEKGSYTTLIGKDRLSGGLLELLRGLLYDDPDQRWTLDDVQEWMDGRRLSPKQSSKRVKATRPILLNNKKYIRPEMLAIDMWQHTDEVAKITENGELEQWLDRAVEDKTLKIRMDQYLKTVNNMTRNAGFPDRLAVGLSSALYTECPVRYKNLSFIPNGFGKALSEAYVQKHDLQPFVEIIKENFVIQAIRSRKKVVDAQSLVGKFDACRSFIGQNLMSSGLERCLYVLDSECPCLSPIVEKYYIRTPEEMMKAFEDICATSKPQILFDRHVVSFLSTKDRKNIDPYMADLSDNAPYRRILGQIRTLATIQKRSSLPKMPALSEWVSCNLDSVYERFHDSKKRDEIKEKMDDLRKAGDLTKIAMLFDDPKLYQNDMSAFYQAMEEYKKINHERELIEEKLKSRKDYGQKTGRQIASVISMFLCIVIILISAYITILKGIG